MELEPEHPTLASEKTGLTLAIYEVAREVFYVMFGA
jgi:hypothetical protein